MCTPPNVLSTGGKHGANSLFVKATGGKRFLERINFMKQDSIEWSALFQEQQTHHSTQLDPE